MADIIPPEFKRFVRQKIASGEYQSEQEIITDGLRLLRERKDRLGQIRKAIQLGRDQIDSSEYTEYDEHTLREFFDELQTHGKQRYEASKKDK